MLAGIVLYPVTAIILTYEAGVGPTLDKKMAMIMIAILAVISVAHFVTLRFAVLPQLLVHPEVPREQPLTLICSFSAAVGIYGLVASIFAGQGLLALPFAVAALIEYFALNAYTEEELARRPGA